MKKRFSLIAVAVLVFSICILSYKVSNEKQEIRFISSVGVVITPPVKISGKKTKTVIPPTKKRVSTASYRTMA